jgi:hypothetical protein
VDSKLRQWSQHDKINDLDIFWHELEGPTWIVILQRTKGLMAEQALDTQRGGMFVGWLRHPYNKNN